MWSLSLSCGMNNGEYFDCFLWRIKSLYPMQITSRVFCLHPLLPYCFIFVFTCSSLDLKTQSLVTLCDNVRHFHLDQLQLSVIEKKFWRCASSSCERGSLIIILAETCVAPLSIFLLYTSCMNGAGQWLHRTFCFKIGLGPAWNYSIMFCSNLYHASLKLVMLWLVKSGPLSLCKTVSVQCIAKMCSNFDAVSLAAVEWAMATL